MPTIDPHDRDVARNLSAQTSTPDARLTRLAELLGRLCAREFHRTEPDEPTTPHTPPVAEEKNR